MRFLLRALRSLWSALVFIAALVLFDPLVRYDLLQIFGQDAVQVWSNLHILLKIFIAIIFSVFIFPVTLVVFVLSQFVRTPFW